MNLKQILDNKNKCTCACHAIHSSTSSSSSSDDTRVRQRPSMSELHDLIQNREWKTVRRAIRLDTSVAMRIDDSPAEDHWFATARRAAWHRSVGMPSQDYGCWNEVPPEPRRPADPGEEESFRVRYWVQCARNLNQSSIIHRRTLLHSICKLKFYSDEALFDPLANGDGDELPDLVNAVKTVEMLIDASHNQLQPIREDHDYYQELEEGMDSSEINRLLHSFSSPCRNCSCYYQSQYCPPVGLDPVERYHYNNVHSSAHHTPKKVLHESVLTMPDNLGATPLHLFVERSVHVDIVRVFLDKCRMVDSIDPKRSEPHVSGLEDCRQPTLYDLLSAQNGHGCTPLHFLSGKIFFGADSTGLNSTLEEVMDAEVLRLILDRFQNDSSASNPRGNHNPYEIPRMPILHPLLIQDGDGELPLHYAAHNGGPASLLSMLTSYPGTSRASLVRNAEGRLPIDELIMWYQEVLPAELEWGNLSDRDDENEDSSEEDDSSERTDDVEREELENEQTYHRNGDPEQLIERAIQSILSTSREQSSVEDMETTNISFSLHFERHLWDPMRMLIQAGANSIVTTAKGTTAFHVSPATWIIDQLQWNPIPASVVLTKYFDFPALALVASILMTTANMDVSKALLKEDSFGLLPLHWACGDIAHLLASSSNVKVSVDSDPEQNSVSTCKDTVHWEAQLPCSMIRYLLHLCPESARVPTREGRLPLHLFLDGGYDERCRKENQNASKQAYIWDDVKELLKACPDALRTPDVGSHLYPFQAAAAGTSSLQSDGERCVDQQGAFGVEGTRLKSLEITYRLIMEDPSSCRFFGNRHRAP